MRVLLLFFELKVDFTILKTNFNSDNSKYTKYSKFFNTKKLTKPSKNELKEKLREYGINDKEILNLLMDEETYYGSFFVTEKKYE